MFVNIYATNTEAPKYFVGQKVHSVRFYIKTHTNFLANPILYNDELLHISAALRSLTSCWQLETNTVGGVTPEESSNTANQSLVYCFSFFIFCILS